MKYLKLMLFAYTVNLSSDVPKNIQRITKFEFKFNPSIYQCEFSDRAAVR